MSRPVQISIPFYEQNFGMKLIHWMAFPQWKFTVYFLERQRDGQTSPECTLEKATLESERYLNNMTGVALELTHNHGTEDDPSFKVWNGNTGRDGEPGSANYAEEPAARGFGHIAFNVDDVYATTDKLLAAGIKFQKKPDEGRMKGLAFALDPDGYWIELVRRNPCFGTGPANEHNFSQTMLRVKDGPKSLAFYRDVLGMTVIRQMSPHHSFSLIFLVSATQAELQAAFDAQSDEVKAGCAADGTWATFDPTLPNELSKTLWNHCLELTWNHGTEADPDFKVHDGNGQPQGFGHTGFLVDDLPSACEAMEAKGVLFKKKPSDGNMRGIAFAYECAAAHTAAISPAAALTETSVARGSPDGYWVELIDRTASFAGICANY